MPFAHSIRDGRSFVTSIAFFGLGSSFCIAAFRVNDENLAMEWSAFDVGVGNVFFVAKLTHEVRIAPPGLRSDTRKSVSVLHLQVERIECMGVTSRLSLQVALTLVHLCTDWCVIPLYSLKRRMRWTCYDYRCCLFRRNS